MMTTGLYTCGNCAHIQKCTRREEPDELDFPCTEVDFITPVRVI